MTNPENSNPYKSKIIKKSSKATPLAYISKNMDLTTPKKKVFPKNTESKPKSIFRQGDILFKRVKALPSNVIQKQDQLIAEGEQTGHAHVLVNGALFELLNPTRHYIKAGQDTKIIHQEHFPIKLESGVYEIIRQKEYLGQGRTQIVRD